MKVEKSTVTKLYISEVERIDPITVYLEDFGNNSGATDRISNRGKITVSCWGKSWTGFWSAMGDCTVSEFFCSCDAGYIIGYFAPQLGSTQFSSSALVENAKRVVLDCRRGRTAAHYPSSMDKDEARKLFDRIEDDLRHVERADHCWNHNDLLSELFGDEWFHSMDDATEPNPDYDYLKRIVLAVQEGIKAAEVAVE